MRIDTKSVHNEELTKLIVQIMLSMRYARMINDHERNCDNDHNSGIRERLDLPRPDESTFFLGQSEDVWYSSNDNQSLQKTISLEVKLLGNHCYFNAKYVLVEVLKQHASQLERCYM